MQSMFIFSQFNQDISQWNVSSSKNMSSMFANSKNFNGDISEWDVSKVTNMSYMFTNSKLKNDISKWKVYNLKNIDSMFKYCEIEIPYWYKNYIKDKEQRKTQIDNYHRLKNLNQKIKSNLIIKNNKLNKI